VVTTLRFVQTPELVHLSVLPSPPPDPVKLAAVEASVEGLPEGELRGALASLGHAMATSPNRPRSS